MDKKSLVLLKTLLLSTSRINVFKYSKDKKKKRKIVGAYIGLFFLYAMIRRSSFLPSERMKKSSENWLALQMTCF